MAADLLPWLNRSSAPATSCFFQAWIKVGCTPCWLASSLAVLSPLTAARATCALKAAVCVFRLPDIFLPFPGLPFSSLIGCPVFGVHYTFSLLDVDSR